MLLVGCAASGVTTQGDEVARSPATKDEEPGAPYAPKSAQLIESKGARPERSPLCDESSASCSELLRAAQLLDERKAHQATLLARGVAPRGNEEEALRGILLARGDLESGELAYGTGGETARKALARLDEVLSRPALAGNLRIECRIHRARALLAIGDGQNALPELEELVAMRKQEAELQAALGIAYLAVGRVARSLRPLRKAVQLDPKEAERHIVLGTAEMLVGNLEQAERSFRGAIRLDGDSARAHGDLGSVLLLRGNASAGRQHLQRASLLEPKKATYASNLSYAELLLKRPDVAKAQALRATRLDPNLASGWLNLGLAEVAMGDRSGARASFRKAQQLDPSDPRPTNSLSDLDELEAQRIEK